MKIKRIFISIFIIVLGLGITETGLRFFQNKVATEFETGATTSSAIKFVSSTINVGGAVVAQDQARLNFQTAGKLVYLPFKEGDRVYAGQTIAKLDSYSVQKQLEAALNNYKVARNAFDQTKDNVADNVAVAQQTLPYDYYKNAGLSGSDKNDAINNTIQRIIEQYQANLNNSVINVELANYALQLSTLTSPLNGVITHEDVMVAGVNITPSVSFVVADPTTMVFRANVPLEYIYYLSEGNSVTLAIDGLSKKITGTIVKIYPAKVILPTGEGVYQVDIVSDELKELAKLDQTGTALISTNSKNVALVPAWTVLGNKYIWVKNKTTPKLKEIKIGKIHGDKMEVLEGLTAEDEIIINPKYISSFKYKVL